MCIWKIKIKIRKSAITDLRKSDRQNREKIYLKIAELKNFPDISN